MLDCIIWVVLFPFDWPVPLLWSHCKLLVGEVALKSQLKGWAELIKAVWPQAWFALAGDSTESSDRGLVRCRQPWPRCPFRQVLSSCSEPGWAIRPLDVFVQTWLCLYCTFRWERWGPRAEGTGEGRWIHTWTFHCVLLFSQMLALEQKLSIPIRFPLHLTGACWRTSCLRCWQLDLVLFLKREESTLLFVLTEADCKPPDPYPS